MNTDLYKCKYCRKGFAKEAFYTRHECTPMRRSIEIQSVDGRMAYNLYAKWFEKRRMAAPTIEGFLASHFYSQLLSFAVWCKDTKIADPEKYIELMIEHKLSPGLWRRTEAYEIYLSWNDKKSDPLEQLEISVATMIALAEGYECEVSEVFTKLNAGDIVDLVTQRKLSPWLLLYSKKFVEWYSNLNAAELEQMRQCIDHYQWVGRMERAAEEKKKVIRETVTALKL